MPSDIANELFKPFAYGVLEAKGYTTTKSARSPADQAQEQLERAARRVPLGRAIAASGDNTYRPWVRRGLRGAMAFEDQVNAVNGLIHWLEFWSKRGCGFHAWS